MFVAKVVAEPISRRFQDGEGVRVGVLLRRIRASRRKVYLHVVAGAFRGLLDRRATAKNDHVGERDFLAAG